MKIESIRTLNGANVYSHQPVVEMRLDLEDLRGKETHEVKEFNVRLLETLPKLNEHFCSAENSDFIERLHEGTHFNHVVEHIAVELLAQAGFDVRGKGLCNGDELDDSKAVLETTSVETTRYIMPLAAEAADALIAEKSFVVEEKITEAKSIAADYELGPSGRAIV